MSSISKKPRFATFLLSFSMFATGAAGLVNEYILSTISTYILGNSIEQFSITIALMMLMMGVAGWVQKFVTDRYLIEKFIYLEIILALLGSFAPLAIYAASYMLADHFLLINYFFVTSIGFLIGFEIPLILRINEKYSATLGINISRIFSADYVGAFIGALIWTFFLVRTFPLTEISFIMALFNFLIAIATYLYFVYHRLVGRRVITGALVFMTAMLLCVGYLNNRGWNMKLEQKLYDDHIVFAKTTKYQRLVMTYNKNLNEYRFYINGNLQFSSLDEHIYHELLVHPAMHAAKKRERVLILGGGDGLALREVLKYKDVKSVLLVDLDPDMIAVSKNKPVLKRLNNNAYKDARVLTEPYQIHKKGEKEAVYQETGKEIDGKADVEKVADVSVMNIDADLFVSQFRKKFDVILIDFPDPSSIELSKLYSKEFFLKLKKLFFDHSIAAIQATSPYHAKESYLCIGRTIASAAYSTIPYHENIPSFGEWGWYLFFKNLGQQDTISKHMHQLARFSVETRFLTPAVFNRSKIFGKNALTTERTDINTLMYPILLDIYLDESWKIE